MKEPRVNFYLALLKNEVEDKKELRKQKKEVKLKN